VHREFDRSGPSHHTHRQRTVDDGDQLIVAAGAGPGSKQPPGTIPERRGQVARLPVAVIGGGVGADAAGVDAFAQCGKRIVDVAQQRLQVPVRAGRRT
jgi:hypothetical protein